HERRRLVSARAMSDFLVIGAGIAGASAAYFLAERGSVVLLEREEQPGYHTTGRSAALYTEAYGNAVIRGLTSAGRDFLAEPPPVFGEHPLLTPRGAMMVARAEDRDAFEASLEEGRLHAPSMRRLTLEEAKGLCPVLDLGRVAHAHLEPDAMDMDVN